MAKGIEHTSEGIILHCLPYGEADAVVTMLSKEAGSLTLFARGGRSSRKARFGVCLQPFTRVVAGYRERSTSSMASLVSMDPVTIYSGISRSLPAIAAASWGVELCRHTALQAGEAEGLYLLLSSYLDRLDHYWDPTGWADVVAFGLGALDALGFRQELWCCCGCGTDAGSWLGGATGVGASANGESREVGGCVSRAGECDGLEGEPASSQPVFISIHDGGLICPECCSERHVTHMVHSDGETLALLQKLAQAGRAGQFGSNPLHGIVSAHKASLKQAKEITMRLVSGVVGRKLKSYPFLEEIIGPE